MKIKAGLCGVLLLFSTAAAYGLGMQDGAPESPAPAVAASSAAVAATMLSSEQIRAIVGKIGVDPDSGNGQVVVRWVSRIAVDPAYRARFFAMSQRGNPFRNADLSPQARLDVLRLMGDMDSDSGNDCRILQANSGNFVVLAKSLSTRGLEDLFEMMDALTTSESAPSNTEDYTVAELLDADARLDASAAPTLGSAAGMDASNPCRIARLLYEPAVSLPQPVQQRATYELFKALGGGKLAMGSVFSDPMAYLDDVFDERRLPDSIRALLPPDGSRPLPWSRVIVNGAWVNKTTPADSAPFTYTFVNRRNNGVVAEFDTSPDRSGKTIWADFTLSYGSAELLSQTIEGPATATLLATLNDGAAIAAANDSLAEGKQIDYPLPQPSHYGQTVRRCEVGKTVPASTIFDSLTGQAVESVCSELRKSGVTTRVHALWLVDYGILIPKTMEDEDGLTDVVVKDVAIEKP
jgi:hypothetical protein